ncbi:cellulose biosynthesis protein BcsS [Methylobacterium sp. ID0610]|uniref:cellulose biosynthesis protein BcsS n=1 Tax=Methylobacterium carpenticola TaxID=3344827 RepID=UPI0036A8CBB2
MGGIAAAWAERPRADDRAALRTVLFGSLDAGRSTFVNAGAKFLPGGPAADGVVLLGQVGYGVRSERDRGGLDVRAGAVPPRVLRHTVLGSALGGWQWLWDWGVVAVFAGPETAFEVLDSSALRRLPAPRFGLRLHAEVWARPTEDTLLTTTAIAGSARGDAWSRLSWGWRVESLYLGPEASLYADRTGYRKWNLGLHLTDVDLARVAVPRLRGRVSAGWLYEDAIRRPGLYLSGALWLPL